MNIKVALTSIIALITLVVIAVIYWLTHHHHPHVDPYTPPAQDKRWTIYNHEVCRNACPVLQCTTDSCINLFNQFSEHERNDKVCQDWWQFFQNAQADDILPDSFFLCGHGTNNEWQKSAEQDQEYEGIWQCAWGPECAQTQ